MKKQVLIALLTFGFFSLHAIGQNIDQKVISSGGGYNFVSSAGSLSGTIGDLVISTYTIPATGILTQGFQQPTNTKRKLNLVFFIEGLYDPINGTMRKVQNGGVNKWLADTADRVTVELHSQSLYSNVLFRDTNVFVRTNGHATVELPVSLSGNYYITIKNWRILETVSSLPVSFSGIEDKTYNFHTSANQAYGNNLRNIAGTYALYSGDVTSSGFTYPMVPVQDGMIDADDIDYVFQSNLMPFTGYFVSDLDGNGMVDVDDVYIVFFNSLRGIIKATP